MKFLFVHANSAKRVYQSLASSDSAIETPIWAGLLENSLSAVGVGTDILDCEVRGLTAEQSAKEIADSRCEMAVFVVYGQQPSASTQNMSGAVEVAELVKNLNGNIKIGFVGGHVSALPVETLDAHSFIDIAFTNEGVKALHEIAKSTDITKSLPYIKGIAYRDAEGVHLNDASSPVSRSNLDIVLPGINWDKIDPTSGYRTAGWHSWANNSIKEPFAAVYTSLGCPYKCSFCMINIINRSSNEQLDASHMNGFRFWSPEFTVNQLGILAAKGVKNIKFADELFVLNPRHFVRICELIIERGYDFNIWAYARVDTCKPEYLEILRRAGVKWLALGIENPDVEQRKLIHKEGFADVNVSTLITSIQSHDIAVAGNYIFGLPGDTQETLENTLAFAKDNLTDMASFYCAMAYPGSPLYRQAKDKGVVLPNEYVGYSQHAYETQNLPTDHLTAAEVLRFRDYAWNDYNSAPAYETFLGNKFGYHAVEQLRKTRSKKLKRRLLGD